MTVHLFPPRSLVYLATPYSQYKAGHTQAFCDAAKLVARLLPVMRVFSPIVHSHPVAFFGRLDAMDMQIWTPLNQEMAAAADVLVVAHLDGWEESAGIAEEVGWFEQAGKPIYDLAPATLMMKLRKADGLSVDVVALAEARA